MDFISFLYEFCEQVRLNVSRGWYVWEESVVRVPQFSSEDNFATVHMSSVHEPFNKVQHRCCSWWVAAIKVSRRVVGGGVLVDVAISRGLIGGFAVMCLTS